MLVTDTSTQAPKVILKHVPCIQYPVKFRKNKEIIQALIDFSREVNAITPAYSAVLGLKICPTAIGTQKIDGSSIKIFSMLIASF